MSAMNGSLSAVGFSAAQLARLLETIGFTTKKRPPSTRAAATTANTAKRATVPKPPDRLER
jgi:hypothetical protein